METRFAPRRTGTGTDLLLRVYPDDIHIDSHEPGVTSEEERWGTQFWQQVAAVPAGPEQLERKRQAWQQLTERFGTTRAAWIAHALDPARSQAVTRRDDTWTRAPYTQALPDRWVAIGYRGDKAHITAWGKPIPETVAVGPAPRGTTLIEGNGLPPIDEGMRWVTDFDAAEAVGMGIRIPLSDEDAQAGFDLIVVLGTKASWDADTTAARLAQLLEAHHYTGSLAFIGQNVPTNNSADASSGYRSTGITAAETLEIELGAPLVQPGSDGEVTAKALGLPTSIFAHVQGAGGAEQRHAASMNAALLALCDSALLRQLSEKTGAEFLRAHFAQFMRAGGPLPALRIDTQPYGLLPVAALDRWMSKTAADAESALAAWWQTQRQTRRQFAPRALHTLTENNPVVMLAQEATSCRYTLREFPEASTTPPVPRSLIPAALRNLLLNRALAAPHDPALDALLTLPESTRQALLAEAMDLATFRFDAWATSLASRRLAALRQAPKPPSPGKKPWSPSSTARPSPRKAANAAKPKPTSPPQGRSWRRACHSNGMRPSNPCRPPMSSMDWRCSAAGKPVSNGSLHSHHGIRRPSRSGIPRWDFPHRAATISPRWWLSCRPLMIWWIRWATASWPRASTNSCRETLFVQGPRWTPSPPARCRRLNWTSSVHREPASG
ncbi:MAG: hypothetical protein E8D43_02965 [Nitrospira sp.]|nr:MAG: hypothetical protein E8D43_02965 [Nitrospira sp.]